MSKYRITIEGTGNNNPEYDPDEMLKRGIREQTMQDCPVDLDDWLDGFHDTEASVRRTVDNIARHPLMPRDIVVRGFVIDSSTGELTEVK